MFFIFVFYSYRLYPPPNLQQPIVVSKQGQYREWILIDRDRDNCRKSVHNRFLIDLDRYWYKYIVFRRQQLLNKCHVEVDQHWQLLELENSRCLLKLQTILIFVLLCRKINLENYYGTNYHHILWISRDFCNKLKKKIILGQYTHFEKCILEIFTSSGHI